MSWYKTFFWIIICNGLLSFCAYANSKKQTVSELNIAISMDRSIQSTKRGSLRRFILKELMLKKKYKLQILGFSELEHMQKNKKINYLIFHLSEKKKKVTFKIQYKIHSNEHFYKHSFETDQFIQESTKFSKTIINQL